MKYTGEKLKAHYSWKNLKFRDKINMDEKWMNFENYYSDVGVKPSDRHRMHRIDKTGKWGPDNWEWREDLLPEKYKTHDSKEYLKEWRKANPTYHRERRYRIKYGVSLAEYEEMSKVQGGRCETCGKHESQSQQGTVRQLAVDHNHKTGKVRGLLCNNCNAAIGYVQESLEIIESIAAYLRKHS